MVRLQDTEAIRGFEDSLDSIVVDENAASGESAKGGGDAGSHDHTQLNKHPTPGLLPQSKVFFEISVHTGRVHIHMKGDCSSPLGVSLSQATIDVWGGLDTGVCLPEVTELCAALQRQKIIDCVEKEPMTCISIMAEAKRFLTQYRHLSPANRRLLRYRCCCCEPFEPEGICTDVEEPSLGRMDSGEVSGESRNRSPSRSQSEEDPKWRTWFRTSSRAERKDRPDATVLGKRSRWAHARANVDVKSDCCEWEIRKRAAGIETFISEGEHQIVCHVEKQSGIWVDASVDPRRKSVDLEDRLSTFGTTIFHDDTLKGSRRRVTPKGEAPGKPLPDGATWWEISVKVKRAVLKQRWATDADGNALCLWCMRPLGSRCVPIIRILSMQTDANRWPMPSTRQRMRNPDRVPRASQAI